MVLARLLGLASSPPALADRTATPERDRVGYAVVAGSGSFTGTAIGGQHPALPIGFHQAPGPD